MQPERADMSKDLGALSGSRADASSPQAVSTEGFDPRSMPPCTQPAPQPTSQTRPPLMDKLEEEMARRALATVELARTHLVQPVNGASDYFYVSFAGQRIEFKLDDERSLRAPSGPEIAALSAKAAKCATDINDVLFAATLACAVIARKQVEELEEALVWFNRHRNHIMNDVSSGHSARGSAASGWMREDDADFRGELREAFERLDAALHRKGVEPK